MEHSVAQEGAIRRIAPSRGWVALDLAALWQRRNLLYFLLRRDLKVRYSQTLLGVLWVVLQPLLVMTIFSVVFGVLGKMPSDGVPYPVFYLSALLPWQLVANAANDGGMSLVANHNLITKVFFPRLVIPLAAVAARLIDFFFCFFVLVIFLTIYQIGFHGAVVMVPLAAILALALGLGVGLWFAALNARYRDVRQVMPFLTQLWFFASPIAYSVALIPDDWQRLFRLNPMVGIIDGFRWALLGKGEGAALSMLYSAVISGIILISGLYYFRRAERGLVDVV